MPDEMVIHLDVPDALHFFQGLSHSIKGHIYLRDILESNCYHVELKTIKFLHIYFQLMNHFPRWVPRVKAPEGRKLGLTWGSLYIEPVEEVILTMGGGVDQ